MTPPSQTLRFLMVVATFPLAAILASCGGGGNSSPGPSAAPQTPPAEWAALPSLSEPNVARLYVDGGVAGKVANAIFADVKICAPADPSNCAVVDHMLVDTGSVGARVFASALPSALLAALPQARLDSGQLLGECVSFVSGHVWGGARAARLSMGGLAHEGMVAAKLDIQVIGDPDSRLAAEPDKCASQGRSYPSPDSLGANGILGIGFFGTDCGTACSTRDANVYFSCPPGKECVPSRIAEGAQIRNPIHFFPDHKNGHTIVMPPLRANADYHEGRLVFGIATRSNNALASDAIMLGGDYLGYFSADINGRTLPRSFIDTGSSATFLPASGATAINRCSDGYAAFLCPSPPLALRASLSGRSGTQSAFDLWIANASDAFSSSPTARALPGIAGASPAAISDSLDLGAPFFFGRSVSLLFDGQRAPGFPLAGPAYAHTP